MFYYHIFYYYIFVIKLYNRMRARVIYYDSWSTRELHVRGNSLNSYGGNLSCVIN